MKPGRSELWKIWLPRTSILWVIAVLWWHEPGVAQLAPYAGDRLPRTRGGEALGVLPQLWVSLSGCDPGPAVGTCLARPRLQIEAFDQTSSSHFTIHVRMDGRHIECPGQVCLIALEETPFDGVEVEFWAQAPEERRGPMFNGRVRVLPVNDPVDDGATPWHVHVLSTQWIGDAVDACAVAWDTFPSLGEPPLWLASPDDPAGLATEVMYHYLGSRLIAAGAVDVSECPDGGMTQDGAPSACGTEKVEPNVLDWQNRFDAAIFETAHALRIPAAIVKRVIAQESQFWPGSIPERGEYGLGHLTELGADNALLWNVELYEGICRSAVGEAYCGEGYAHQSDYRGALMRGSLIAGVDADCPECEWGVDLDVATDSVQILGEALLAYCSQTGRMVANVTGDAPGRRSSYEEMWRVTLASYAAGPGCIAAALKDASRRPEPLTWTLVSGQITPECSGAIPYVDNITR